MEGSDQPFQLKGFQKPELKIYFIHVWENAWGATYFIENENRRRVCWTWRVPLTMPHAYNMATYRVYIGRKPFPTVEHDSLIHSFKLGRATIKISLCLKEGFHPRFMRWEEYIKRRATWLWKRDSEDAHGENFITVKNKKNTESMVVAVYFMKNTLANNKRIKVASPGARKSS